MTLPAIPLDLAPWLLASAAVFVRLLGLVLALPFWRGSLVPMPVRVLLVVFLSLTIVWSLGLPRLDVPNAGLVGWIAVLLPEFLLGLALGLFVRVVLAAAEGMGRILGLTIGLGFATFVDPSSGDQSDAVARLLAQMVLLLFLGTDAHLFLLRAVFDSFHSTPVGQVGLVAIAESGRALAELGDSFFELSLRLAAPVIAGSLMIYVVLAVITKVAPQMNLFAIGFVVTIPAGLFLLFAETPQYVALFGDQLERLPDWLRGFAATGAVP